MANYDEELHEAAFFCCCCCRRITWQHLQHLSVSQGLSVSHSVSEQCPLPFFLPFSFSACLALFGYVVVVCLSLCLSDRLHSLLIFAKFILLARQVRGESRSSGKAGVGVGVEVVAVAGAGLAFPGLVWPHVVIM